MADPTVGPNGSSTLLIQAAGADGGLTETTIETTGFSNWRRISNQLAPSTGGGACRVYLSTYGTVPSANQEMWTKVIAQGANGTYVDMIGHYTPGASSSFFEAEIDFATGTDAIGIYKRAAGTPSQLGTDTAQEVAAGTFWAVTWENSGSDVIVKQYLHNGTTWGSPVQTQTATAPGATLQSAGNFGLEGSLNSAVRLGDIRGGPFVTATKALPPSTQRRNRRNILLRR